MFCITLESHDPYFNLAIEELLFNNSRDEYLILGINSPSLIIGKHQSPHREINTKYVFENKIPVIRRISGGGSVFHDMGNLNFCFIRSSEPGRQVDFRKYTNPVIGFLASLGVEAKFEGRNDLKVNGLKISGNAEHIHRNRVLHHGTLLFSTSLDMLRDSLRKDSSCYSSRAIISNPSSVTNVSGLVTGFNDIFQFRKEMMKYLIVNLPEAEEYSLSEQDIEEAHSLAFSKYRSWEWNFAYGPEYEFANRFEIGGEIISCRLYVRDGIIRDCLLESRVKTPLIGEMIVGCRHTVEDMKELFSVRNISITEDEIFHFF
jgi:lipoate---protein ligase